MKIPREPKRGLSGDTSPLFNHANHAPDTDPRHYVSMMTSASHTYGCALAYAIKWVLEHFPRNTFKTIHTSTRLAHTQLRRIEHEVIKKKKPMIIFRPRVAEPEEDKFLKGTPLIERQTDLFGMWGVGVLQPFINDPAHNFKVSYQMNRAVINMDVAMLFETYMQQQDYVAYVSNAFKINHPGMESVILESYIPEDMIYMMSLISEVPVYDDENCTQAFFKYFNPKTINSILSYKLQDSTGRKEFFRAYPCNMELTVSNVGYDDGDKHGHITSNYQVTFSVRMEFNTTGMYYIYSDNLTTEFRNQLRTNFEKYRKAAGENGGPEGDIIPHYVDIIDIDDAMLPPGWEVYTQCQFALDKVRDNICIDSLLNQSIKAAIDYHAKNGMEFSQFYDVRIRRNGNLLVANRDYKYFYDHDKKSHTIYFNNRDTAHSYSIIIVINAAYVNDLIRNAYDIK